MTIGEDDAASALEAIKRTRQRAFELRGYAHSGSIVIAWGLVWMVCNLTSYVRPDLSWVWPIGILLATIWSGSRGSDQGRSKPDWRAFATAITIVALIGMVMSIAGIRNAAQGNALISIFVAGAYVLQGIWTGQRYAWIGLVIAGCVIAGWFFDRAHLELWLGIGGGGALILTGLWLRRA